MKALQEHETAFRFSSFCHRMKLAECEAFFHSLLVKMLFVPTEVAERIEAFRPGLSRSSFERSLNGMGDRDQLLTLVQKLVEARMLVPVSHHEEEDLEILRSTCLATPIITGMYMMLTDRCNIACDYCFVTKPLPRDHHFTRMSSQTAEHSVDQFAQWSSAEYPRSIIFCGGEPLLNRRAFLSALNRIESFRISGAFGQDVTTQLITNGTLVDSSAIELAKRFSLKVSVSIDGKAEFHDAMRKTRRGTATHAAAVRAFRMFKDAGAMVGVSMTIGQHQAGHLLENVQWLVEELGVQSMGFNTLMDIDPSQPVSHAYAERINQEMIMSFRYLRERGVYEDRIMRKVEAFVEGTPYLHDCSGCGHQIVVAPEGSVGVCHGYAGWQRYFVQPDDGFHPVEHPYWKEWVRRSPVNMPQCYDCEALGICGGGCACSADIRRGSIWAINDTFCIHAKAVLRWMLEETYCNVIAGAG